MLPKPFIFFFNLLYWFILNIHFWHFGHFIEYFILQLRENNIPYLDVLLWFFMVHSYKSDYWTREFNCNKKNYWYFMLLGYHSLGNVIIYIIIVRMMTIYFIILKVKKISTIFLCLYSCIILQIFFTFLYKNSLNLYILSCILSIFYCKFS